ncbi:MAG: hypothetical protein ACFCUG_10250 [Thiotrichales bacterium]
MMMKRAAIAVACLTLVNGQMIMAAGGFPLSAAEFEDEKSMLVSASPVSEMSYAFRPSDGRWQVAILSEQEMETTQGAIAWLPVLLYGAVTGGATYAVTGSAMAGLIAGVGSVTVAGSIYSAGHIAGAATTAGVIAATTVAGSSGKRPSVIRSVGLTRYARR